MDKELQDLAWSVLPKEFKEEVNGVYFNAVVYHHPCGYNHKIDLLNYLFGYHNLTSDAEEVEMLTCEKYKVEEALNYCDELDSISGNHNMRNWGEQMIAHLFGSKCLPDETKNGTMDETKEPKPADDDDFKVPEYNCKHFKDGKCAHPAVSHIENGKLVKGADCDVSSCEDVEYEPKFKVGDTVRIKYCCTPHRINGLFKMSNSEMLYLVGEVWVKESDLEPYIKPEEKSCTDTCTDDCSSQCKSQDFGTIVKDSFRNERRLNIAAQIVASMVGSDDWSTWRGGSNKEIWHNMAKSSLEIADALLAEVEKKGDEE